MRPILSRLTASSTASQSEIGQKGKDRGVQIASSGFRYGRKRNKFSNQRTSGFASKLEHAVYVILQDQEKLGLISDIKCQVQVHLTNAEILYKPDFSIFDNELNQTVYVEAKGMVTPSWAIKKRLWKKYGPGILKIYTGTHSYPKLTEIIVPEKE